MKPNNIKKYTKAAIVVLGTVVITAGCQPLMYAQDTTGTYPIDTTDNGYNYDNGYNDAPPPEQNPGTYDYGAQGDANAPYDQSDASNEPTITYDDFYTQLSPYGQWASDPTYGRVWIPNVSGFQPYSTNGYWTYTNYGWTWVSNYNWGWAPFHYGRWGYGSRGWFWVPGYSWGPAWVAWSSGSGMYGWAPLAPGLRLSVGISIGSIPANYWTFMPGRYMGSTNIYNYYSPRSRNVTIIKNTTIINNYGTVSGGRRRYTLGPQVKDVEKVTGRTFQPSRVVNARDPKSAVTQRNTTETRRVPNTNNNNNRVTAPVNNNNPSRINNSIPRTSTNPPSVSRGTVTNPPARNVETPARTTTNPPANNNPAREVNRPAATTAPAARTYTETHMYRPQVKPSSNTRPVNTRSAAPQRSSAPARSGGATRGRR